MQIAGFEEVGVERDRASESSSSAGEIADGSPNLAELEVIFGSVGVQGDCAFYVLSGLQIAVLRAQGGAQGEKDAGIVRLQRQGALEGGDGRRVLLEPGVGQAQVEMGPAGGRIESCPARNDIRLVDGRPAPAALRSAVLHEIASTRWPPSMDHAPTVMAGRGAKQNILVSLLG